MAGTITVSTISDGSVSTSSTNCIQGSAKAWASITVPSTPTVGASYNVSSFTRSSAGNYTINFTNAMANANYAVTLGFQCAAWGQTVIYAATTLKTTTQCSIQSGVSSSNLDATQISIAIFS
jgi:hypothetical protein